MNIRISATREISDPRVPAAYSQAHRRRFIAKNPNILLDPNIGPIDVRLECVLGRMRLEGRITDAEYNAGCRWRSVYHNWLASIGAPSPFPAAVDYGAVSNKQELLSSRLDDDSAEILAEIVKDGIKILKSHGARVFHAVNSVAVYEEPEELGDFEFTAHAAKRGLAALAEFFG